MGIFKESSMINIIDVGLQFKNVESFHEGENKVAKIVWHHAEASSCSVQDIHAWHLANGWNGIGYHLFIRKDGTIYQGRKFGWRGSHCPPANYNSIGVCCEGDFRTEVMSATQLQVCLEVKKYLQDIYGQIPSFGHKELWSTECPAKNFPLDTVKGSHINDVSFNNGGYMSTVYKNGSTPETVYSDSDCTKVLGSLDPFEQATCIYEWEGKKVVLYKVDGTNDEKVGFVKFGGEQ
jgi:hypothetical protein